MLKIKQKGYILVGMLFMMVLIAVSAISLNRKAGMQERMATNHTRTAQLSLGQMAVIEHAAWQLMKTPDWRTDGDDYFFSGVTYTRKVQSSSISGYTDVITITVNAPASLSPITTSFRVNYSQTAPDFWVIADTNNNCIRKVDSEGTITTVAGNGIAGYSGDGGPATSAQLNRPKGVYLDASGNIFIADTTNNRIRKVDTSGIITTFAGTTRGFSGDNGPATLAQLDTPEGLALDTLGNIYINDTFNYRIRKVDVSTGNISTIAGNGSASYSGDDGPATSASIRKARGIYVDSSGNVYIADTDNHRIRKVDATTQIITTVAGNGSAGYSGDGGQATAAKFNKPYGVYLDASGNMFIADSKNDVIRKVDGSGILSTVAGTGTAGYSGDNGSATSATLDWPQGVNVDKDGNIYIADTNNHCIRKVDIATGNITTVAGTSSLGYSGDNGPATSATLNAPQDLAVYVPPPSNNYFIIADTINHCIRKVDAQGIITTIAGIGQSGGFSGDNGDAASAQMSNPKDVFVDADGNLFIADSNNHVIRKVDAQTQEITTVVGTPTSGGFSGDGGAATSAQLNSPNGVFVDDIGNIFIADTSNNRIRKVDAGTGDITTIAGTGSATYGGDGGPAVDATLNQPWDVFVDSNGDVYIADTMNNCVRRIDASTQDISLVAGRGSTEGSSGQATQMKLKWPKGVYVDKDGFVYIADTNYHCIRKIDPATEELTTVAGIFAQDDYTGDGGAATSALLKYPYRIDIDDSGNMFIACYTHHVIRKVDNQGIINTVAGDGSGGFLGDGGLATDARMWNPHSVVAAGSAASPPGQSTTSLEKVNEIYWRVD